MMAQLWERGEAKAPIEELYAGPVEDHEMLVLYFGWAGILLRTAHAVLAFDLCQHNFHAQEARKLARLDVHTYSHSHWDHWHAETARAIARETGAPMIIEPQILELGDIGRDEATVARAGEPIRIGPVALTPIVGIHPRPITLFHVATPAINFFHGADSGHVPLHAYDADLAIVPVGTPSPSCSPESAVAMIRDLGATAAIAVHGSDDNMRTLRKLVGRKIPDLDLRIPRAGELIHVTF